MPMELFAKGQSVIPEIAWTVEEATMTGVNSHDILVMHSPILKLAILSGVCQPTPNASRTLILPESVIPKEKFVFVSHCKSSSTNAITTSTLTLYKNSRNCALTAENHSGLVFYFCHPFVIN